MADPKRIVMYLFSTFLILLVLTGIVVLIQELQVAYELETSTIRAGAIGVIVCVALYRFYEMLKAYKKDPTDSIKITEKVGLKYFVFLAIIFAVFGYILYFAMYKI